jgi:hypothetical protein
MRRALHLVTFGVIFLSVRACGVNESYDRLKYGADRASETLGLPGAKQTLEEQVVPAVVGAASRSVDRTGTATLDGAEAISGEGASGLWGQIVKAADATGRAILRLLGRPVATPAPDQPPPAEGSPRGRSSAAELVLPYSLVGVKGLHGRRAISA